MIVIMITSLMIVMIVMIMIVMIMIVIFRWFLDWISKKSTKHFQRSRKKRYYLYDISWFYFIDYILLPFSVFLILFPISSFINNFQLREFRFILYR